ncbi:MAG: cold-shock protein [Parvibaculales bacterium]
MITGTVKWFNATKGYGFIAVEGENDVFVHISAVEASGLELKEDMKVEFEKQEGKNGKFSAVNLVAAGD